jgi:RNA polymerase sigma-70 factor (ECF subfamily)
MDMSTTAPPAASPARAHVSLPAGGPGWAEDETARLYSEYRAKIYRHCLRHLRSREDAEDAVQNTFLRVHTALQRGVVPEFEGPWLYKIAHNVCLSRRLGATRRARVEAPTDLGSLEERTAAREPPRDELFGLDDALAAMPPRLRCAILLREWQGLSYAEIAETLDISHSAVETLIFRARRHLAKALENSVSRPARRVAGVLNLPSLLTTLRGLLADAGAAKLAAGVAVLTVAATGGVVAELVVDAAPSKPAGSTPRQSSDRPLGLSSAGALSKPGSRRATPVGPHLPLSPRTARSSGAGRDSEPSTPPGGASPAAPTPPGPVPAGPVPEAPAPPSSDPAPSPPGGSQGDPVVDPTLPALPTGSLPDPTLPVPSVPIPTDPAPTVPEPTLPLPTVDVPEATLPAPPTLP